MSRPALILCACVLAIDAFLMLNGSDGFDIEGLFLFAIVLVLLTASLVVALVKAFDRKTSVVARLATMAVWAVTLLITIKPPDQEFNFIVLRGPREHAVRLIQHGTLSTNERGVVDVSAAGPMLSAGGNEAMVDTCGTQTCVLFFYYRGILHHYNGFLYVPSGGDPGSFDDTIQEGGFVKPFASNWYFVGQ